MIVFLEATSEVDKIIVSAFNHYGYNSKAHDGLINRFINHIADVYKGKYTKEELVAAFNKMYKRNVVLTGQKASPSSSPSAGKSNYQIQDSNPNNYEASPNIIQRLYNPRPKMMVWGNYQLNKYEQDIVNFINTNNHSKMDAIRKKPAFVSLSNKLIKNAPVQKALYRKENSLRVNKVGDIVSFDLRSFSANPYHLTMVKFTKEQGQEVIYRITGLRGINIGAYDDFTNVSFYEDEYLCTGNCRVTAIGKQGDTIVVDAKAV
jgi:predicted MPP superfamily phosphohydrolase